MAGEKKPGTLCDTPVISMDFFPTFLELANLKPGKQPIDGESLLPLLTEENKGDLFSLSELRLAHGQSAGECYS